MHECGVRNFRKEINAMTSTGIEAFDKTIHTTNEWFKDLMFELNWDDRRLAYRAMRTVLQNLRDRLKMEEAVHLGAQLPMLIRGLYYEGWNPARSPDRQIDRSALLSNIREALSGSRDDIDPEQVIRAIFKLLYHRVADGEIEDVKQVLPSDLVDLWPRKMAH
jgi:uncharacterized protein (DUF2267 family)